MSWLGLDVGGANLKLADGRGWAASRFFPLWREPQHLAAAIGSLLGHAPSPPYQGGAREGSVAIAQGLAVTMTGELADCFETKREGVARILDAVSSAAGSRPVRVYLTEGSFAEPAQAKEFPLLAAAANWHALARFAGRFAPQGAGLLVDIGSTTTDIIPLQDGLPIAQARTDPERLAAGELVYTGVQRSPVCALVSDLPWRGGRCPVAQELFATTWDAYLLLGDLPEEPENVHTADGRGATRAAACDRLARMICADRELFDEPDALAAAAEIREAQLALLETAARRVLEPLPEGPHVVMLSGSGEFLGRQLLRRLNVDTSPTRKRGRTTPPPSLARRVSVGQPKLVCLSEELGPEISRCATAHALAVLAEELMP